MTPETVDSLVLAYGLQVVFIVSFLSCLAVPLPASLVFMAAGTYAATGELSVGGVWLAGLLGAVLGEFFGKIEYGVGLAMILAQQSSNGPQVWALALLSGIVALLGFALVGLIARAIAPWSKGR